MLISLWVPHLIFFSAQSSPELFKQYTLVVCQPFSPRTPELNYSVFNMAVCKTFPYHRPSAIIMSTPTTTNLNWVYFIIFVVIYCDVRQRHRGPIGVWPFEQVRDTIITTSIHLYARLSVADYEMFSEGPP